MKNVTGLDLVKLMAGSWGTLGFFTEVIFKVLPRAGALRDARASAASTTGAPSRRSAPALGSPFETSGAAHLPAAVAGGGARTLIRIEGFSTSVDYRLGELKRLLRAFGAPAIVEGEAAEALWRSVRDVTPLRRAARHGRCGASRPRRRKGPAVVAEIARALGRALVLRLGRRARLDRDRRDGRRRRRGDPRRGQAAWRPRHARARAGRGPRRRRRVRALARSR